MIVSNDTNNDYETLQSLAIEYDNSELLDVHTWSDYPEVNGVVNLLYKDLLSDPKFTGNEKIRKKHIKVIVLDLYVKWLKDPLMYVAYHRSHRYYEKKHFDLRYNKLHITRLTCRYSTVYTYRNLPTEGRYKHDELLHSCNQR